MHFLLTQFEQQLTKYKMSSVVVSIADGITLFVCNIQSWSHTKLNKGDPVAWKKEIVFKYNGFFCYFSIQMLVYEQISCEESIKITQICKHSKLDVMYWMYYET